MLESLGLGEAVSPGDADVVVFNTCTIREKPDQKLAAHLAQAGARKRDDPDLVIAVGGCYAEAQRERIFERYPQVDVAFGPGSILHLGEWIAAGGYAVPRGRFGTHEHFSGHLPMRRERRFQAWVQVSMGCNSACAYCIVPAVRGREQSRRPGDILREVRSLAADGVREITLLGQNVNSWGRDLLPDLRADFGELLRALRRGRRNRPDPVHEPSPEGLPRACDRRHRRVRSGLRARAPAPSVGLRPRAQGHATDLFDRPLPRARRAAADGHPRSRARHGPHRRLPGRDGRRLQPDDARGGAGGFRQRLHVRLLAAAGHGGRRALEAGARGREARTPGAARRRRPAGSRRAQRDAGGSGRAGPGRGPEPHAIRASCAGARGETPPSTSRARRPRGRSSTFSSSPRPRRRCAVGARSPLPPDACQSRGHRVERSAHIRHAVVSHANPTSGLR